MARPKKEIDEKQVLALAKVGATTAEIAAVCGVSADTIERRYAAVVTEGKSGAKLSVRRELMRRMKKSDAVLIHLSKAFCGNTERTEHTVFDLTQATREQLERIAAGEDPAFVLSKTEKQ